MGTEAGVLLVHCNTCCAETEHDQLCAEKAYPLQPDGARCLVTTAVVPCRGCRSFAIRREIFRDVPPGSPGAETSSPPGEVIYEPPRSWWRPPDWLADLDKVVPELKTLLDEIYSATNDRQFRLLAMGYGARLRDDAHRWRFGKLRKET